MAITLAPLDDRQRLFDIIATRSFRQGETFTLVSGRQSTIYFNLKPTMLYPEGARLIGKLIARKATGLGADYVAGLEMGAVPIVTAVAAMSAVEQNPVRAFFIRKKAKEHGTMSLIEGLAKDTDLAGARIAIVEDVTTTGGSALKAVDIVRQAGGIVENLITIVDREEGAGAAFTDAGITLHALYRKSDFAEENGSESVSEPNR